MKSYQNEILLALSLLGIAPLVAMESIKLWERPHFQFFPLAWFVFIAFIYTQATLSSTTEKWRINSGVLSWATGMLIGIGAAYLVSPWLAHVAAILIITGWGLIRLDSVPWTRWLGWSALLWATLPLPGILDRKFINELQRISSESASSLLDLGGVLHLRQGNIIEIRSGQLFVDEACSGVDSLYSLVAITLVMLLWKRRPFVVGLLAIASVPVWAWLGNVMRLTIIILTRELTALDLSHGWKHTLLGLAMFALSSGGLLATLEGLSLIFKRFSSGVMPEGRRAWHLFYNAVVCFPGKAPEVVTEADLYFSNAGTAPKKAIAKATKKSPSAVATDAVPVSGRPFPRLAISIVSFCVLLTGGLSTWGIVRENALASLNLPHYQVALVDRTFSENAMPESIHGAKRTGFDRHVRSIDSYSGEYSRTWHYRDKLSEFLLSIDFPFRGFHGLWVCYISEGQTVQGKPVKVELPGRSDSNVIFLKFQDQLGSTSYLWFTLFDMNGNSVPMGSFDLGVEDLMTNRLTRTTSFGVDREPVTYQFQMFVTGGKELPEAELARYTKIFEETLPLAERQVKTLVDSK